MNLRSLLPAIMFACMTLQPVLADDLSDLKAQMKIMQQQMQIMQNKLEAQESVLKEQQQLTREITHQRAPGHTGGDSTAKNIAHEVADSLAISGVVEVVTNHTNSGEWSGDSSSDIVLDTFELGIDAAAGAWTSAHILFLYEDALDDNLLVDEAYVTFANSEVTPFYAAAGRLYVPFGNFTSNMLSDPVTLTLGETRAEVIQLGVEMESGFYGSAYVFNGDVEESKGSGYMASENNHIDNYGLNLGYTMENDDFSLDLGAGYINNIATSGSLSELVDGNALCAGDGCIKDYIGGLSLYAIATFGQFNLIGEYVTALEAYNAGEISDVNSDRLKPKAWNFEGAYNFDLAGKEATIALGYQKTKDMYLLDTKITDFFEKAWFASISVGIIDNTTLAAEWKHSQAYSEVKDARRAAGDKYDDEDILQIKLSYEF